VFRCASPALYLARAVPDVILPATLEIVFVPLSGFGQSAGV